MMSLLPTGLVNMYILIQLHYSVILIATVCVQKYDMFLSCQK